MGDLVGDGEEDLLLYEEEPDEDRDEERVPDLVRDLVGVLMGDFSGEECVFSGVLMGDFSGEECLFSGVFALEVYFGLFLCGVDFCIVVWNVLVVCTGSHGNHTAKAKCVIRGNWY